MSCDNKIMIRDEKEIYCEALEIENELIKKNIGKYRGLLEERNIELNKINSQYYKMKNQLDSILNSRTYKFTNKISKIIKGRNRS